MSVVGYKPLTLGPWVECSTTVLLEHKEFYKLEQNEIKTKIGFFSFVNAQSREITCHYFCLFSVLKKLERKRFFDVSINIRSNKILQLRTML